MKNLETKIYVLDQNSHDCFVGGYSDEKFMELAEEDGRVYSLEGFQNAFNMEEVNTAVDIIRIIKN